MNDITAGSLYNPSLQPQPSDRSVSGGAKYLASLMGGTLDSLSQCRPNCVSHEEMKNYIAGGADLALKIKEGEAPASCSHDHVLALSWFIMSRVAEQGEGFEKGTVVIKDESALIFNFLRTHSECYGRISTHFNEWQGDAVRFKHTGISTITALFSRIVRGKRKNQQWGIEDYENKLPFGKGAVLFNTINGSNLFVKFEPVGMPPVFRKGMSWKMRVAAFTRCFQHAIIFLTKRGQNKPVLHGTRKEHVPREIKNIFNNALDSISLPKKGVEISEELTDVLREKGVDASTIKGERKIKKTLKKIGGDYGLSTMEKILSESNAALLHVQKIKATLWGEREPQFTIEGMRKGNEVHVDLYKDLETL